MEQQNQKNEVVIVGMARTAIGNFMGTLSNFSAVELGVFAAREAMRKGNVKPEDIDEVTAGMVYKAGAKANPARQIQLTLGIPFSAGATTIDQQCASGMRALEVACQQILLGKTQAALVCGIESMSNVPFLDLNTRKGVRMGAFKLEDGLLYDALHDVFLGEHMAITAENVAEAYKISREDQDEMARVSNERALAAIQAGKFKEQIVPIEVKTRKGTTIFDTDEHPRETTMDTLSKMKTAFKKDGTITAGNASSVSDGASAMVVMSRGRAEELGLKPLAVIRSTATVGVEPRVMGIGPIYAIPKAAEFAGMELGEIEYYEINEAFAAQALAVIRELDLSMDNVNANGSGISLGHPVGSTGLRLVIAAYYELVERDQKIGCGSLCAGGGPAMAVIIERL
jgi:acetyl-CoA C-acetyltransferase